MVVVTMERGQLSSLLHCSQHSHDTQVKSIESQRQLDDDHLALTILQRVERALNLLRQGKNDPADELL
jgi:hypothetical protein